MKIREERGFTLAETAVVIGVLGILLILGIMNYRDILRTNEIAEAGTEARLGADTVFTCLLVQGTLRQEQCVEELKTALPDYADTVSGNTYYRFVQDPSDPSEILYVDFCKVVDSDLKVQHRYTVGDDELESRAVTSNSALGQDLKDAGEVDGFCAPGTEGWCDSW